MQFAHVVLFVTNLGTHLEGVLARDKGQIVFKYVSGEILVAAIIIVPAEEVGTNRRPAECAERIGKTEFIGPGAVIGKRARAVGIALHAGCELIHQSRCENVSLLYRRRIIPGILPSTSIGVLHSKRWRAKASARLRIGPIGNGVAAHQHVFVREAVIASGGELIDIVDPGVGRLEIRRNERINV